MQYALGKSLGNGPNIERKLKTIVQIIPFAKIDWVSSFLLLLVGRLVMGE